MTELQALKQLSARLGADPLLVQAAGGNTSLKANGTMWIKASGTWLKDAVTQDIFVGLDHAAILQALTENSSEAESCVNFILASEQGKGLRPSIETTVHAALPQAVVLHVHCVNTIALAIRLDAQDALAARLKDFNYIFVPYTRPGLPLALNITKAMRPHVNVLILGNHGLVVAAETVAAAEALLTSVVAALQTPARHHSTKNLNPLISAIVGTDYVLPQDETLHAIACDPITREIGATAVYYPDHVVFLGPKVATSFADNPPIVAIAGAGVVIHRTAKPAAIAMARCLVDVFARVSADTKLNPLTPSDLANLTNWDAEKYRQKL